ncbi:SpoIIE family protein phosphatase [Marinitoga lauensis]|uniref:SpoIIE family protein phosphatase n=1 Tax=Marinitoga lauensis TaxID=2201189 RepID=UPI0010115478|nr:cache domain-containing protein [Marinitoga lauensis]
MSVKILRKNKLLSLSLLFSFLLITAISIFSVVYYYNTNLNKSQDYIKSENSVIATFIDDYFTELIHVIETFSNDNDFINGGFSKESEKKVLETLKNYRNANKNIEFIYTGYKNKKIIIDNWEVPPEYDPTIRPWYLEGLKNPEKVYIGTPYREYTSKQWLISTGKALIKDGEVVGVLSADCSIKDFVNLINSDISYKTGQSFVINKDGIVILHKDLDYINKKLFTDLDIFKGKSGIIKSNFNSKKYYIAYTKLASTGWYVITMVESAEILAPVVKSVILYSVVLSALLVAFLYIQSILYTNLKLKKTLEEKNKILEETNRKLTDSITYAKHIQNSILLSEETLKTYFKDIFVFWKPANIVGGDFYWFKKSDDNSYYLAVIDCTGHGVPGALMTMTVNSILNRIIEDYNLSNLSDILNQLNIMFKNTLNSHNADFRMDDGLEIGICHIIPEKNKLIYSGAGISLYYNNDDNEIVRIKGKNIGIGYKRSKTHYKFEEYEINIKENMNFYLTTDGFEDQNNSQNKRFGRKKLIQLLQTIHNLPMNKQKEIIQDELKKHMDDEDQRDDITILGFKLKRPF